MKYDIAIIGGGPAGLIAASRASELGAKVILLEKNNRLGIKLLLTGGGRCNLTNNIPEPRTFVNQLGQSAKFLLPALHRFGAKQTLDYFHLLGLKTKEENNGRIFPVSNQAISVLTTLVNCLKKHQVEIKTTSPIKKIVCQNQQITKIIMADKQEIIASQYILATGGQSYPETGSSGDGCNWLEQLGLKVITPQPSLTPLLSQAAFLKELEGLSVINAKLTLYQQAKKIAVTNGDVIFTANGLSGPAALDISRYIDVQSTHDLRVEIDFLPELETSILDKKLQQLFTGSKQLKNTLTGLVIPKLKPVLFKLARINPDKKASLISRLERLALIRLLKNFNLKITGLAGFSKAMITKGGLALTEIDPKTMRCKKINNLYVAGEIVDLTGPTGGYNLQICWTTGYLAGESAANILKINN